MYHSHQLQMIPVTLSDAQAHAAAMGHRVPPPECYLWRAFWWHMESNRGYPSSVASLQYGDNLLALRRDMLARPEHYRRKPQDVTDYQWSQK